MILWGEVHSIISTKHIIVLLMLNDENSRITVTKDLSRAKNELFNGNVIETGFTYLMAIHQKIQL